MSTKGKTWSTDPERDKRDDIVAVNLDLIETLIIAAQQLHSQNERVRALRAGQLPLTTRTAQSNSLPATNEKAA